jgi:soluble lytic murein transglycosylase-like protein
MERKMSVQNVLFVYTLLPLLVFAQTPHPAMTARIAMQASIEKQRASVRLQQQSIPLSEKRRVSGVFFFRQDCEPVSPRQFEPIIDDAARKQGLTKDLLWAVIQKESAFRPCAVSPKGALGLMQLMPSTAFQLGVIDPLNPIENINGGAKFLRYLLDRYGGDLWLALGAYNAGPGRVDAAGGVPAIPETVDYVLGIQKKLENPSEVD